MKSKIRLIVYVILVGIITSSMAYGMGTNSKSKEKVKIGAVLPLTGKLAFLGDRVKNGMIMANDELKGAGKTYIEIVFSDSKSAPKDAVSASNKLINIDRVDALVVLGTPMVNAVYPITEQNQIPLMAQTIHPQITTKGSKLIQYFGGTTKGWQTLGEFFNKNGKKNIVVFSINAIYGEDCFKILKQSVRSENITNIVHDFGTKDFTNIVLKHKKELIEAEVIVLIGYASDYMNIVKSINEAGIANKTYASTEAFLDPRIKASPFFQDSIAAIPKLLIQGFQTKEYIIFEKAFYKKFKSSITFEALYGYFDTMLLANYDLETIANKLNNHTHDSKIGGMVKFVNREAYVPVELGVIKNGEIIALNKLE